MVVICAYYDKFIFSLNSAIFEVTVEVWDFISVHILNSLTSPCDFHRRKLALWFRFKYRTHWLCQDVILAVEHASKKQATTINQCTSTTCSIRQHPKRDVLLLKCLPLFFCLCTNIFFASFDRQRYWILLPLRNWNSWTGLSNCGSAGQFRLPIWWIVEKTGPARWLVPIYLLQTIRIRLDPQWYTQLGNPYLPHYPIGICCSMTQLRLRKKNGPTRPKLIRL